MKKKPGIAGIFLFIIGLLCIGFLFFISRKTFQEIQKTKTFLGTATEQFTAAQQEIDAAVTVFTEAVEIKQKNMAAKTVTSGEVQGPALIQNSGTAANSAEPAPENTDSTTETGANNAHSSQEYNGTGLKTGSPDEPTAASETQTNSVFNRNTTVQTVSNGHIVGIDPGHQGYHVDMSDLEPNGPGSSEMKAKATTGTQGIYTGLPEYQLNLDISLKLRDLLESRGYQVVLTREDNDTAISNSERAQLVAAQGAEIYVRIHANGENSHTVSGALTMAPSAQNPYVSHLSEASVKLSQCIIDAYCDSTGFQNHGVQYYDNMTGINWSTVPVTILEMGFMTHEYDDTQMSDSAFQDLMVQGIADGIDAYFAQ